MGCSCAFALLLLRQHLADGLPLCSLDRQRSFLSLPWARCTRGSISTLSPSSPWRLVDARPAVARDAITPHVGVAAPHVPAPEVRLLRYTLVGRARRRGCWCSLLICTLLANAGGCGLHLSLLLHTFILVLSQLCLHTAVLINWSPQIGLPSL